MHSIIIADDEALECKVLEKIICDNFSDVRVLPSAPNGLELVKAVEEYEPDIALVDINMPGLNGLSAIELIRAHQQKLRILVVSAYSKFEYAQKALYLGASGYILKPVKEESLIENVRKLLWEIDRERQREEETQGYGRILNDYKSALENEFLFNVIKGEINEDTLQQYLDNLTHPFYGAFIVSVRRKKRPEEGEKLYQGFLENMKKICRCSGKIQKQLLILCIMPVQDDDEEGYKRWLLENIACVREMEDVYREFTLGISSFKYSPEELVSAVTESQLALVDGQEGENCFWMPSEKDNVYGGFGYGEKRKILCRLFQEKNYELFYEKLKRLFEKAKPVEGEFVNCRLFSLAVMHDIFDCIGKSRSFFTNQDSAETEEQKRFCPAVETSGAFYASFSLSLWDYWKRILRQPGYEELFREIHKLLDQITNPSFKGKVYSRHVKSSLNYIFQHYMEDLSLDTVAYENKISNFYLSRLLKQELHFTFLEILTDIRINKAFELLYKNTCSVQQIGDACGYQNVSYFYKIYKKQTGMTIGEMRERLSRLFGEI